MIVQWLARLRYKLASAWWWLTRPITVGVRLLPVQNGRVLLVKHTYQESWYLPGGMVERGETLEEAVRREAAEELGATLGALRLFGVYTNFFQHKSDHVAVFVCEDFTLTGETDVEIERYGFFQLDALPPGTSPGSLRRIQAYLDGIEAGRFGRW